MAKRVFISFDYDNDKFLRDAMVGHARNEKTDYEIEDWSVDEPWPEADWKEKCRAKIKRCDLVIVMVGPKTASCSGVKTEIQLAKEEDIPVVAIRGYSDKVCPKPAGVSTIYKWTWENVSLLVKGNR